MTQLKIKIKVYEYDIEANIKKMDKDIHILLIGGELPHVGAVSIFHNGKQLEHIQLEGHKDGILTRNWASKISEQFSSRVTVIAGIHYDNATRVMVESIMKNTEEMLQSTIEALKTL